MSTAAAPTTRVESVLQRAELELWRDNIDGALDLLARAHTLGPITDMPPAPRRFGRGSATSKAVGRTRPPTRNIIGGARVASTSSGSSVRILLGRKTRKTVRRVVDYPEYQLLEREIIERRPARVPDAGCGEGRIAL